MRLAAIIGAGLLLACSSEPKATTASAPHGPLAELMTQHASASCGKSSRTYEAIFWKPPYQTCSSTTDASSETAEIDSDSVVVELYNTWTVAPAGQAALFAQTESELMARFGAPNRCSATKSEWRQGDSLHMVLQIAPVSEVGTEFNEGPYRLTRMARLGPLDPGTWGC